MRFLGNLFWLIICGLECAVIWFFLGILLCITIVGIPFGVQCFQLARLVLSPFGATVS